MQFKDLFSSHSDDYARFRPVYPKDLYKYLALSTPDRSLAWDCGTGNGQAAIELATYFEKVIASDPSEKQLANAQRHPVIEYRVGAESANLESETASLITVAQALHWFNQQSFFSEANFVLKRGGILAIWCYELSRISPSIDRVVEFFYRDLLYDCWEKERLLVEQRYAGIVLPFTEVTSPKFEMTSLWSFDQFIGFLSTWSAVQTYKNRNGKDPLKNIYSELKNAWGSEQTKAVHWPLHLRVAKKT